MNNHQALDHVVRLTNIPASFGGDRMLYAVNLFLMTAFMYVGFMVAIEKLTSLIRHRMYDRWNHPVTLHRLTFFCAGMAVFLRCGAEAAVLWSWNPRDVSTTVEVMVIKRYLDPLALVFAALWMSILTMSSGAMEQQLRKQPFPVKMWAKLPSLARPALIVALAAIMAFGVVWAKG